MQPNVTPRTDAQTTPPPMDMDPAVAELPPIGLERAPAPPVTEPGAPIVDPAPRRPAGLRRVGAGLLAAVNGVMGYLLINITSAVALVLFRVLSRTHVHGRFRIGLSKNTLLASNHRTMIDSYLLGHIASWPWGWLMPRMLPYHPAAKENFFRNRVIGWFSARWRCIPVSRGVKDFAALRIMTETLPKGQMLIFPEGTRSRDGELLKGRPGTGKLIHDTQCKVVPMFHQGMSELLPIGRKWPRMFRRIDVYVGKPIDLSDLLALPSSKETSKAVIERVMAAIAELKSQAEADTAIRLARRRKVRRVLARAVTLPLRRL